MDDIVEKPFVIRTTLHAGMVDLSWLSVVKDIKNVTSEELLEEFYSYIHRIKCVTSGQAFLDRVIYRSTKTFCTHGVSVQE